MTTSNTSGLAKTVGIVLGSVREGRFGEQVAHWVLDAAAAREGDVTYQLLDLGTFNVPALTAATIPGAGNKQYDVEEVTRWSQAIDACDGFIFVTPEYNHSVPGAMKNAFDSLGPEWVGKPVAFVGYGADGGVRAVEHWRQIVANLSMLGVRNQVALSLFDDTSNDQFAPRDQKGADLQKVLADLEHALTR